MYCAYVADVHGAFVSLQASYRSTLRMVVICYFSLELACGTSAHVVTAGCSRCVGRGTWLCTRAVAVGEASWMRQGA